MLSACCRRSWLLGPLVLLACSPDSNPAEPAPPVATTLAFGPAPTANEAGRTLGPSIQVTVRDAGGATVTSSSAPVTLSLVGGSAGAVLGGTFVRAAVNGVATFDDITVDRAGASYTLQASSPGLAPGSSASFDITPAVIVLGGDALVGLAGYAALDSLVVRIEDPVGTPRPGASVAWAPGAGAMLSVDSTTDAQGRARATWLAAAGAHAVRVSSGGTQRDIPVSGLAPASCGFTAGQFDGFPPRDTLRFAPSHRPVRVAALFVDFPDFPATQTVDATMNSIVVPSLAMLEQTTDGALDFDVIPSADWLRMPELAADLSWSDFASQRAYIDTVLARFEPSYDFADIDAVWIFRSSPNDPKVVSGTMTLALGDFWQLPPRDGRELHRFVTFGGDVYYTYPEWTDYGAKIVAHETGHVFGLPDLYAYEASDPVDGLRFTGGWSFMGFASPGSAWTAAERHFVGAMPAAEMLCPPPQPFGAVVRLAALSAPGDLRAMGLRDGVSTLTFLEVRRAVGLDAHICAGGLLAYDVDGSVATGEGPVVVREARSSAAGAEQDRCGPKWNAPFQVGDTLTLASPDITVTVLGEAGDGSMTLAIRRR